MQLHQMIYQFQKRKNNLQLNQQLKADIIELVEAGCSIEEVINTIEGLEEEVIVAYYEGLKASHSINTKHNDNDNNKALTNNQNSGDLIKSNAQKDPLPDDLKVAIKHYQDNVVKILEKVDYDKLLLAPDGINKLKLLKTILKTPAKALNQDMTMIISYLDGTNKALVNDLSNQTKFIKTLLGNHKLQLASLEANMQQLSDLKRKQVEAKADARIREAEAKAEITIKQIQKQLNIQFENERALVSAKINSAIKSEKIVKEINDQLNRMLKQMEETNQMEKKTMGTPSLHGT